MNLAIAMHDQAHVKAIATALRYPFAADPAIANSIQGAILEAMQAVTPKFEARKTYVDHAQKRDREAQHQFILAKIKKLLAERPGLTSREIGAALGMNAGTLRNWLDRIRARGDLAKVYHGNIGTRYYLHGHVAQ